MIRNDKVLKFRLKLIDKVYDRIDVDTSAEVENKLLSLLDKHSYGRMVTSFKPLTLEAWFTKEEINLLNGNDEGGETTSN